MSTTVPALSATATRSCLKDCDELRRRAQEGGRVLRRRGGYVEITRERQSASRSHVCHPSHAP
ncbi:MAG: hypothetical protein LC808_25025, partial [Actinobacteria bacterium]|nr:hypothetical protein [Actinomycetota bacterium]